VAVNSKRKTLKIIVRIWSKNSASVQVTVNNKEENPEDFCLDFVQEFGLMRSAPHSAALKRGGGLFGREQKRTVGCFCMFMTDAYSIQEGESSAV
jgi:hypothetical protein